MGKNVAAGRTADAKVLRQQRDAAVRGLAGEVKVGGGPRHAGPCRSPGFL